MQALSAQDLRLLEGEEREGEREKGAVGERVTSGTDPTSSSDLLAALCPEEVETCFGPSYTHGCGYATAVGDCDTDRSEQSAWQEGAEKMEKNQPWQQLAQEIQQEEEVMERELKEGRDRGVEREKVYNPLNCILSTVSRREAVTVLYPYGLTIRRFQILLDR